MIASFKLASLDDNCYGGSDSDKKSNDAFAAYGSGTGISGKSKSAYILVYDRAYKKDMKFEYDNDEDEEYLSHVTQMSMEELQLKRKVSSQMETGDGSKDESAQNGKPPS